MNLSSARRFEDSGSCAVAVCMIQLGKLTCAVRRYEFLVPGGCGRNKRPQTLQLQQISLANISSVIGPCPCRFGSWL